MRNHGSLLSSGGGVNQRIYCLFGWNSKNKNEPVLLGCFATEKLANQEKYLLIETDKNQSVFTDYKISTKWLVLGNKNYLADLGLD